MSHFYSSCQGGKGEATRCGHRTTGIRATAQNWTMTISVRGNHLHQHGKDIFSVEVGIVDNAMFKGDGESTGCTPLLLVHDLATNEITVRHNIQAGHEHNVKSHQATFDAELEDSSDHNYVVIGEPQHGTNLALYRDDEVPF